MADLSGDALKGWETLLGQAGITPSPTDTIVVTLDTGDQVQVTGTSVTPVE
jgi:hypothetical protein